MNTITFDTSKARAVEIPEPGSLWTDGNVMYLLAHIGPSQFIAVGLTDGGHWTASPCSTIRRAVAGLKFLGHSATMIVAVNPAPERYVVEGMRQLPSAGFPTFEVTARVEQG